MQRVRLEPAYSKEVSMQREQAPCPEALTDWQSPNRAISNASPSIQRDQCSGGMGDRSRLFQEGLSKMREPALAARVAQTCQTIHCCPPNASVHAPECPLTFPPKSLPKMLHIARHQPRSGDPMACQIRRASKLPPRNFSTTASPSHLWGRAPE